MKKLLWIFIIATIFSCEKNEYIEFISECLNHFEFPNDGVNNDYYVHSVIGKDSFNLSVSELRTIRNIDFIKAVTREPSFEIGDSTKTTAKGISLSLGNSLSGIQDARFYISAYDIENMYDLVDYFFDAYLNEDVDLEIREENQLGKFNIGVTIPCYEENRSSQTTYSPIELNTESGKQNGSWLKITELKLLEEKSTYDLYVITFDFKCIIYDNKDIVLNFEEEMIGQFRTEIKVNK